MRPLHIAILSLAGLTLASSGAARAATEIPGRFVNDGVYVRLATRSGQALELYTDTGGGGLILSRRAADRLGLAVTPLADPEAKAEMGPDAAKANAPAIDPRLPPLPSALVTTRTAQIPFWTEQLDGVLGAPWFAGRIWTWDFPGGKLWLEDAAWTAPKAAVLVPLGFKTNPDGSRPTSFPRMAIEVDGRRIEVLLDTGAVTVLKPAARTALGVGDEPRATSMIVSRIFEGWRRAHPDWRYIPDAQARTGAAMIEAPHVVVAGFDVGPVWFTERPDANYDGYMSAMMDKPVEGSIGGNALRGLRMTIDYPRAQAWFACETACRR